MPEQSEDWPTFDADLDKMLAGDIKLPTLLRRSIWDMNGTIRAALTDFKQSWKGSSDSIAKQDEWCKAKFRVADSWLNKLNGKI